MENITLAFTIILSFVGIIISIASLIFAVIYFIKIAKLQSIQLSILKKIDLLDNIKSALLPSCTMYSDDINVSGREAVNAVCNYFKCDEWRAISLLINQDPSLNLIDWANIPTTK